MALQRTSNHFTAIQKIFLLALTWCLIASSHTQIGSNTIFAQATTSESTPPSKLSKVFKGMSPGMQRKMSFMALATSKIDSEEQKAAIRKQFQKTFQTARAAAWTQAWESLGERRYGS